MNVDPVLIVYGLVFARAFVDQYGDRIAREYDATERKMRRFFRRFASRTRSAFASSRDLSDALADIASVNAALMRLAKEETTRRGCAPGGRVGWRWRATLSYRERGVARASVGGHMVVPAWARAMTAECGIDFEEVRVDRRREGGEEDEEGGGWRRRSFGYSRERRPGASTTTRTEIEEDVDTDEDVEDEDAEYELVHVVRRASLEGFYSALAPMIQQLAVDADSERRAANRATSSSATATSSNADGNDAEEEDDSEECSICMDNKLEVVVNCGHAFCEECHARWCRVSMTCPICRQILPRELDDESDASFALVDFDDVRDATRMRDRSRPDDCNPVADFQLSEESDEASSDLARRAHRIAERIAALPAVGERTDAFGDFLRDRFAATKAAMRPR
jgi:hypothetical protein